MTSVSGLGVKDRDVLSITWLRVVLFLVSVCIQSYGLCQILRHCASSTTARKRIREWPELNSSEFYKNVTATPIPSCPGRPTCDPLYGRTVSGGGWTPCRQRTDGTWK
jgi:hypothetical protein